MKVAANGPEQGGVVEFENWSWPGVALRGDDALALAGLLEAVAREADQRADHLRRSVTDAEEGRRRDLLASIRRATAARHYAERLSACFVTSVGA